MSSESAAATEPDDEAATVLMDRAAAVETALTVTPARAPLWRRLGAWIARKLRSSMALPPLPPLAPGDTLVSQGAYLRAAMTEEMLHLLWHLPPEHLRAVLRLGAHINGARVMGRAVFAERHAHFVLLRLRPEPDGCITVTRIRDRLLGCSRDVVDEILLRLEADDILALFPAAPGIDAKTQAGALQHPTRGPLGRCMLLPDE